MSRKHSCMPTEPRSRFIFAGSAGLVPGVSRDSAKPTNLTLRRQSVVRGLRRDGCMGALGSTARSLAAKCQTNLVLSVRSATFPNGETERQRSVAVGKWPCSRLMPLSWPGEASRPIAGPRRHAEHRAHIAGPGRGEASRPLVSCFSGRARAVLTVSPVCGRRNEAIALRRCLRIAAAEWSGCKAGESVIVRGRNRADTWCGVSHAGDQSTSGGSVTPGFCFSPARSEATRFQCLTPRLKSSANLNGWNARMTFKDMKPLNARAV